MRRIVLGFTFAFALAGLAAAQQSTTDAISTQQIVVPRLLRFSGQLTDEAGKPLSGTVGITFSLYKSQTDKASLWIETQNAKLDAEGKYSVLLGATKTDGLPMDIFASGEARWLGMTVNGKEQSRVLFVSVPYALKAAEAETLAGHTATDFVTSEKLTTTVKEQVKEATTSTKSDATTNTVTNPATNFVDNNTTQVVNVTQNGTGTGVWSKATSGIALRGSSSALAIYGSSTGTGTSPAIQGVTASPAGAGVMGYNTASGGSPTGLVGLATGVGGIGIYAKATATSGSTRGLSAYIASPSGIAGLFANAASSGNLITGQGGSPLATVFNVTTKGNVTASGIFSGNGSGLTNVNATKLGGVSLSGLASLSAANTFTNQQYINTAKTNYALQVYNTSASGSFGAGVLSFANNPDGIGVYGEADSGQSSGVFGYTTSTAGAGIYGQYKTPANIYGNCCTGYLGVGMWADTGDTTGIGLLATADNSDASVMYNNSQYATLYVENDYPSSKGTAYVFFAGNANNTGGCGVDTFGNLNCSGSINGTVRGGSGQKLEMYGVQSTENWYEDAGSSALSSGVATVKLDADFAAIANTAVTYQVFLTPNGDCKGLYVTNKSPNSFEVRELGGGTASIGFDYRIVAKRKGAETVRMRPAADTGNSAVYNRQGAITGVSGARGAQKRSQQ